MNPLIPHLLHQALFGGVAALCFAVLFNCRPAMLPYGFAAGFLTLATRTFLLDHGSTLPTASFFAALLVAIIDRVWKDAPSPRGSLLAVVGSIPMIPGGAAAKVIVAFFAVVRAGPVEPITGTWENLIALTLTLAAIGTALALPSLFQPEAQRRRNTEES